MPVKSSAARGAGLARERGKHEAAKHEAEQRRFGSSGFPSPSLSPVIKNPFVSATTEVAVDECSIVPQSFVLKRVPVDISVTGAPQRVAASCALDTPVHSVCGVSIGRAMEFYETGDSVLCSYLDDLFEELEDDLDPYLSRDGAVNCPIGA